MNILTPKSALLVVLASGFWTVNLSAQTSTVTVMQDPKFEQLLNEKRKINSSITIYDRYKIQIYSGDSENSKKMLADFRKNNNNLDGTIVFNTPVYKVWIGNFKTRIDAERNLAEFKKKYPTALLVKPNK